MRKNFLTAFIYFLLEIVFSPVAVLRVMTASKIHKMRKTMKSFLYCPWLWLLLMHNSNDTQSYFKFSARSAYWTNFHGAGDWQPHYLTFCWMCCFDSISFFQKKTFDYDFKIKTPPYHVNYLKSQKIKFIECLHLSMIKRVCYAATCAFCWIIEAEILFLE